MINSTLAFIISKPLLANGVTYAGLGTTIASLCGILTPVLGAIAAFLVIMVQYKK